MVSKRSCVPESKGRRRRGGAFGPHRAGSIILILAAIVVLGCGYLLAAESTEPNLGEPLSSREPARADMRYRVFSLKHISAEKGKEFLAEAKIGTVSHLSGTNMLLVTALPKELIKASAILKLVDSNDQYVMKTISAASAAQNYLANEQIQAELRDILIGTFVNPPTGIGQTKAIIDVHDGSVVAITPADQFERIVSAFRQAQVLQVPLSKNGGTETVQLGAVATDALILAEPNQSVEPNIGTLGISAQPTPRDESYLMEMARQFIARERAEPKSAALQETAAAGELVAQADANESDANGLFNRLLSSLAQAEKKAAGEQAPPEIMPPEGVLKLGEPNEPGLIAVVPMPNEPGVGAGVPAANEPGAGVGILAVNEPNLFVVPTPEANVPSEPSIISKEPADRLQSVAISEILRRIQALEAGIEAAPAPRPEPEIKPVAPKIEHPNEVSIEQVPAEIEQPNDVNEAAEPEREDGLYDPEPLPNGKDVLKIQLPETLPMIDFLSFMGEHLQLDYLYDPAEVKGNVTLRFQGRLRGEIRVEELYPLLESVMHFHGFVMTRKGSLVTIRKTDKIDTMTPDIIRGEGDKVEAGDVIITRVFELKHVDPVSAQNLLTNMKLGKGVTAVPEAGNLVVTEYAFRMARIEELLEMIDKPGEPKQFRFRQLKYTMATVLASKVEKLVQQLGEVSVTVARTAEKAPTPSRDARGRITRTRRPPRGAKPAPGQPQPSQPTVYLDFDERTNRILMIGHADQLDVVEELIDALDVAQQDLRTLRVYEIQYIDAEEVRRKLGELGIIGGVETTPRRSGRREQPTRKPTPKGKTTAKSQPPPTAGTAGVEQPLVEEPQVIIIESINSLLVNATDEQHAQIAIIIGHVDNEAEMGTIPYVIYQLENQSPEELAAVLNQLIQETTTRQEKDAKIITTTKKLEEDISIIPDPKTYSLIVYASKKNQQWISSLIRQLDEYRPQVLLDCTLVEITKNDAFNLAIDWVQAFPDLTEVSGRIPSLTEAVLPETRDRFIEFDASGSAFYGDDHINFLLTAVQTRNFGRVLARPKILVNDNEIGTIKTEETQYIVRLESQISAGTTGTTSTTRSSVNFDSFNAGVTLEIEPHISKGDQLRLKVSLIRSDFRKTPPATVTDPDTGEARVIEKPPDTVTSDVQTTVTVPDGYTIILGGMEKLNQSKGGSKVPFLGDIPFIGGLFRDTQNEDVQARLYVFVRASIMRPGEVLDGDSTLEVVSGKNRATFEKYEREMQEYEDWPGIKPTPMDPLRILEVD